MSVENRPVNLQAELAKERNRAAAERTLMAWIRTSLALISFGFGINSIVAVVQRSHAQINAARLSTILALAFIGLGTYAMVMAAVQHRRELRYVESSDEYLYRPRRSLALTVAVGLVAVGAVAFGGVLLKAAWR